MPFTRLDDRFADLKLEPTPDSGAGVPNASGTTDGSVATKLFAGVDDENPFGADSGPSGEADFSGLLDIDFDGRDGDDSIFNTPIPGPLPSTQIRTESLAVIDTGTGDEVLDPRAVLRQLGASDVVESSHATPAEVIGSLNMRVLRTMELQDFPLEVRQSVAAQLPSVAMVRNTEESL